MAFICHAEEKAGSSSLQVFTKDIKYLMKEQSWKRQS